MFKKKSILIKVAWLRFKTLFTKNSCWKSEGKISEFVGIEWAYFSVGNHMFYWPNQANFESRKGTINNKVRPTGISWGFPGQTRTYGYSSHSNFILATLNYPCTGTKMCNILKKTCHSSKCTISSIWWKKKPVQERYFCVFRKINPQIS